MTEWGGKANANSDINDWLRFSNFLYRPASATVPEIIRLIDAGMSIARFNMSHGSTKVSLFTSSQLQNLILNFDCFAFNLRACVGKCPHDSKVLRGS